MKRYFALIAAAAAFAGCSGSAGNQAPTVTSNTNPTLNSNVTVERPDMNGNVNSPNPPAENTNMDFVQGRKKMVDTGGTPVPPAYKPGDENSEVALTMNPQGQPVEYRRFKNNPDLEKAEAVWLDTKMKKVTITLRGGKTVEVTTDSFENLAKVPAAKLIELAKSQK
jgi:hypothetical protein